MGGQRSVVALDDFLSELVERARVEGRLQRCHFVEKNTERPNVGLKAVTLALDDFRRQVVWGPDDRFGFGASVGQDACNAKIAKLYNALLRAEDVLALQVAVQDLLVVAMLECESNLSEPVE